jgi:DNA polymerase III epsilon subunit-like protein
MQKILWVDVETTGFSPKRNGIISIAAFMMIDGVIDPVKGRFVAEMSPEGREITESALAVNGFTRERIEAARHWSIVGLQFAAWIADHSDRFPLDLAVCGGYVTSYDVSMIGNWLESTGPYRVGDFIEHQLMDVCEMAKRSLHPELCLLPNKKLSTVSKALGIDLGDKAHSAEADILATIEVYKKLVEHDEKRSFS